MFVCSLFEFENLIESEFSDEAELFYDIRCDDPFDSKCCFEFPFVVLHETGIHLAMFFDGLVTPETKSDLDYMCRVFKSYFSTRLPVRSVFLFRKGEDGERNDKLTVYSFDKGAFLTDSLTEGEDVIDFLVSSFDSEFYVSSETEQEELFLKLSKEGSDPLESSKANKNSFVKRKGEWVPAFRQDSEKVFKLALFGGFLGLHRFYLGLFGSGLLYFFTLGFFGLGWFFDCLEIILGTWRRDDKYLQPLSQRGKCIGLFVLVFGALGVLVSSLLSFFLKNIQNF